MQNATISKVKSGWNNFFGNISSGLSEGLHTVGKEVLPVWAANQLGMQTQDQLENATINRNWLPASLTDKWGDQWQSIQNSMGAADDYATLKKPLFTVGGVRINALVVAGFLSVLLIGYLFTSRRI